MEIKITGLKGHGKKKFKIKPAGIFIVLLFGIFLAFLCGEIALRIFFHFPVKREYLRFSCFNYKKISRKKLDRDLFWKFSNEFRNVKYSLEKGKDMFRVICIGDSITQGYAGGKGLLPVEQTYPYKLERMLAAKYKNKQIEIINAGSGGYSSLQGLRYLEKILWKYDPDLVISWFGVNDNAFALFYPDKEQKMPVEESLFNEIFGESKLYLFFKNLFFIKQSFKTFVPRVSLDDFYDNCEQMLQVAKENDFEIVFIAPFQAVLDNNKVEYLQGYPVELEALSRKYGSKVLYLKRYLDEYNLKKIYVDTCHLNDKGNDIVAQAVFELLKGQWDKYLAKVR